MPINDSDAYVDQIVLKRAAGTGHDAIIIVNRREPHPEHLDAVEKWAQDCRRKLEEESGKPKPRRRTRNSSYHERNARC